KNYVCSKCFKAKGKAELEKQNKQQLVDAQSFEEEHGLPEIEGSDKQIPWATRVRYEVLAEIVDSDESENDQHVAKRVIEISKSIPKAGWWLDNCTDKSLTVDDLIELITTAVDNEPEEITLENPYRYRNQNVLPLNNKATTHPALFATDDNMITVYGKPGCRPCRGVTRQLDKANVPYEYIDLAQHPDQHKRLIEAGCRQTPIIETP